MNCLKCFYIFFSVEWVGKLPEAVHRITSSSGDSCCSAEKCYFYLFSHISKCIKCYLSFVQYCKVCKSVTSILFNIKKWGKSVTSVLFNISKRIKSVTYILFNIAKCVKVLLPFCSIYKCVEKSYFRFVQYYIKVYKKCFLYFV